MANTFEYMTFLFAGKLNAMKHDEAEAKVTALGGKVASCVSKNLSVLVATSETSAKWTKAQELNGKGANIQRWTEERFLAELEKAEAEPRAGETISKNTELNDAENSKNVPAEKAKHGTTKEEGTTKNTNAEKVSEATKTISKPKLTPKQLKKLNKALFVAIESDEAEEAKSLIDAGADVNAKNNDGETALHRC